MYTKVKVQWWYFRRGRKWIHNIGKNGNMINCDLERNIKNATGEILASWLLELLPSLCLRAYNGNFINFVKKFLTNFRHTTMQQRGIRQPRLFLFGGMWGPNSELRYIQCTTTKLLWYDKKNVWHICTFYKKMLLENKQMNLLISIPFHWFCHEKSNNLNRSCSKIVVE